MDVQFLQDEIIISASQNYQYVYLFGIGLWIFISLSGLFAFRYFARKPSIGLTLFTLVSFLPFSYLCYDSHQSASISSHYTAKIDSKENTVSFGDSNSIPDVIIPFSDWKSYIITSESKSEKGTVRYTDTISLEHKNGFNLPVAMVQTSKYSDALEEFSRYAELNRELRRFSKILPLPMNAVYGKKHPGVFLNAEIIKQTEPIPTLVETKSFLPELQLPFRWKYIVSNLAWGSFFAFLCIGHFGILMVYAGLYKPSGSIIPGMMIVFVFYPIAFWVGYANILTKKDTTMLLAETGSGYRLSSIRKNEPPELESEIIKNQETIVRLELPLKVIYFVKSEVYKTALELAEKSDKGDLGGTFSDLGKIITEGAKQENWNLSDLPLEYTTALYFRLSAFH
ncbi:hypothetical protein [Leptospira sp. 'Mane']|uniref:hypothetical protein n=1 Tax=Leptospira sp. 'Mane' TaxID=3387407 RepID=UPI00398B6A18